MTNYNVSVESLQADARSRKTPNHKIGSSLEGPHHLPASFDGALLHPFNWPQSRKLLVTYTAVSATFLIGLNATAEATAGPAINAQFGISDATFPNSYWPITAWNFGAALVPLILLPLMENFGVRYIYIVGDVPFDLVELCSSNRQGCYFLFLIFMIPQAVAQNFATLIVSRFFAGSFGATVQNAVANIAGDLWESDVDRSFAITLFNIAYLGGFTLGPVRHLDYAIYLLAD